MPDTRFDGQGRTAVITGGSGVLGRVLAHALAKAGVRVAILSLHAASSANVVESIQADGGEAIGIACDVMERADLERAYTEVLNSPDLRARYGRAQTGHHCQHRLDECAAPFDPHPGI